jgi:hypothetical protein
MLELRLFRRRAERPAEGGDIARFSSGLVGYVALLPLSRACTDDILGEAWFIVKPLNESVIGDVSKSQTDMLRVADSPEVRRDPIAQVWSVSPQKYQTIMQR